MDQRLFFLINSRWTTPFLDRLMAAASALDVWLPFLILLLALTTWFGGRRARLFLLALGVMLLVGDAVVGNGLKHLVHRPRPFQSVDGVREVALARPAHPRFLALFQPPLITQTPPIVPLATPTAGRSFPSDHTLNNFAAAVLLALFYRRRGFLYFFPAMLVSYSRIYVGSHWPTDVLISALLGSGLALLTMALFQRFLSRWLPPPGPSERGS